MIADGVDQVTLAAALGDAARAEMEFDQARAWLERARQGPMEPIAAEAWVFDAGLRRVVLVRHRWRGWVCPGGKVESSESPRAAASRELREETGLVAAFLDVPAAVFVRSYRPGWAPTLGLAYAARAVAGDGRLSGESGQPAEWVPLAQPREGAFPEDAARIRGYAARLAPGGTGPARAG